MNQTSKLKEQKDHGTSVFPCGLYEVFDNAPWEGVKHHWHDEIEILYFMKGNFKVKINMESFPVEEECFFFVNPGEIHSVDCSGPATESAIVFHPCILNFEHYDLAQTQLIQPLTKGEIQLPRFLDSSHPAFHKIKKEYLDILNVFHQTGMFLSSEYQTVTEDIASQLFIRAGFLKMLGFLSSFSLLTQPEKADDYRVQIIKSSLEFIRKHYQEKIYIRDLAGNASMNEQYFCRFFKQQMGINFTRHVNQVRISHIHHDLVATEDPIMEIIDRNGFTNYKLFHKLFREIYGCTPREARQEAKEIQETSSHIKQIQRKPQAL